jgi:hypothetical protein
VLMGHIAVDPCSVVLTANADLEPEPRQMKPGSVRITIRDGETVELCGDPARAWWRFVEETARHLEPKILTSHGRDVEMDVGAAREC